MNRLRIVIICDKMVSIKPKHYETIDQPLYRLSVFNERILIKEGNKVRYGFLTPFM